VIIDKAPVLLSQYSFQKADETKLAHALSRVKKECLKCKETHADVVILECVCMYCLRCLKQLLLGDNEGLLFNTFEAGRKKEAMCVCPKHGWAISTKLLAQVFGSTALLTYSLNALQRQLSESMCILTKIDKRVRNRWPNLCADCKGIMCDDGHWKGWVATCYRHKICKTCVQQAIFLTHL
jgi:hypothetical protein